VPSAHTLVVYVSSVYIYIPRGVTFEKVTRWVGFSELEHLTPVKARTNGVQV